MTATLCLKATRSFLTPLPLSRSLSPPLPHRRLSFPKTLASVTMTSSFIEHVVLFKVKPSADPTLVNAMVNGLNSLVSLDLTLHLAAAPLLRLRSSPFAFTHLLHSRYPSKDSLAAYAAHPAHVSVVKENILPICDDIMAVDWVGEGLTDPEVAPGSAVRVTFLKVKEGMGEEEKGEILEVVKGIKGRFSEVGEVSVGENFSPGRAKGYSIGSVAVFKDVKAMESVDAEEEKAKAEKDKFYNKASRIDIHEPSTWVGKGQLLLAKGEVEQAFNAFKIVLDGDRDNVPSLLGQVCVEFNRGQFSESLELYKRALLVNPDCPAAVRLGIGLCRYKMGQFEKAWQAFHRVLEASDSENSADVQSDGEGDKPDGDHDDEE